MRSFPRVVSPLPWCLVLMVWRLRRGIPYHVEEVCQFERGRDVFARQLDRTAEDAFAFIEALFGARLLRAEQQRPAQGKKIGHTRGTLLRQYPMRLDALWTPCWERLGFPEPVLQLF